MLDLTRRSVLGSLGAGLALAGAPFDGLSAATPPPPTLETIFGPERFADLNEHFQRRSYLPYGDIHRHALLNDSGDFLGSKEFRARFTEFLVGNEPFQLIVDAEDVAPHLIDANILLVFWKYRVVPKDSRSAFYEINGKALHYLWRVWRGDDWKKAGWSMPPPERIRGITAWYWPRPEAA